MKIVAITPPILNQFLLNNPATILLLDARPSSAFDVSHIHSAINTQLFLKNSHEPLNKPIDVNSTTVNGLDLRIIGEDRTASLLYKHKLLYSVVVYDNGTNNGEYDFYANLVLQYFEQEGQLQQVYYLTGGFGIFYTLYPNLCVESDCFDSSILSQYQQKLNNVFPNNELLLEATSITKKSKSVIEKDIELDPSEYKIKFPIEILPFLYQGSEWTSKNYRILDTLQIEYVLNVTEETDNFYKKHYTYLKLELSDFPENDLVPLFTNACRFIDYAQNLNSKVLVHCLRGVNRSTAVVLAYLIYINHWRLEQAYDFLKRKYQYMKPNIVLLARLIKFEESILGSQISEEELKVKYQFALEDITYLRTKNKVENEEEFDLR
jgi:protein-tyrosine phosphatase/rhodanese-related sulfurtransferase